MVFYEDTNGDVHAIPSKDFESILPNGCVEITQSEADAIVHPPETEDQAASRLLLAVEAHMDWQAQTKGGTVAKGEAYDNRYTCAIRAGYTNPWQAEGKIFGEWMDNCYNYCYQVRADVQANVRSIPTEEELIAELPAMVWP